jgi:hypothetical protein
MDRSGSKHIACAFVESMCGQRGDEADPPGVEQGSLPTPSIVDCPRDQNVELGCRDRGLPVPEWQISTFVRQPKYRLKSKPSMASSGTKSATSARVLHVATI